MPLDPDRLLALDIPSRDAVYEDRDVLLYALSVGAGLQDDARLYQDDGLRVIPSFAQVLAFDDSWIEAGGISLAGVVHGGLDLTFHRPLEPAGFATVASCIAGLTDKGEGRGGIIQQNIGISQNGADACTARSTIFVIGGGGFGGSRGDQGEAIKVPDTPAPETVEIATRSDQALLFRLLGDRNPLHSQASVAKAAGFDGPILHGACTFGIACLTALTRFCGGDPARMQRFATRFTGPLYPGETLAFEFWPDKDRVVFRASTVERGSPVLDGGMMQFAASAERNG